jgi:hypothetical protein
MDATTPKPTAMAVAYQRVREARRLYNRDVAALGKLLRGEARRSFPAPMFWADRAETADSMEEGTRNTMPINFSTMPTAAASASPRRLAMMVITMKAI